MAILTIIVRHAKPTVNFDDPEAPQTISETGRMMQEKVNRYLKKLGIEPTEIWSSPVLRAKQTAEMLGEEFGLVPKDELALSELEMFDENEITEKLAQVPDESTIILVTHGPQILRLARHWMEADILQGLVPTSSALFLEFPKSVKPGTAQYVRLVTYSDLAYEKP